MENYALLERQTWACVADAVAYYYAGGFKTVEELDDERIMRDNNNREVRIVKKGFLDVRSSLIQKV
jgi:hypothetical protein